MHVTCLMVEFTIEHYAIHFPFTSMTMRWGQWKQITVKTTFNMQDVGMRLNEVPNKFTLMIMQWGKRRKTIIKTTCNMEDVGMKLKEIPTRIGLVKWNLKKCKEVLYDCRLGKIAKGQWELWHILSSKHHIFAIY